MRYLLIRHAKTDANRLTRAVFGKQGAPINKRGVEQVKSLEKKLKKLGINTASEPIAISELLRAKQTAELAGFKNLVKNSLLNEVNTLDPTKTLELVAQAKLPDEARQAAKAILANPPKEQVWITHGLVIAAMLVELGLSNPKKFIPDFCEIIEIEF